MSSSYSATPPSGYDAHHDPIIAELDAVVHHELDGKVCVEESWRKLLPTFTEVPIASSCPLH